MPDTKYAGSPSGEGNPPGKYSKGYLGDMQDKGHFVEEKGYKGGMDVGRSPKVAPVIGNQPKQNSKSTLASRANKQTSY